MICILIRSTNGLWRNIKEVASLIDAEEYWKRNIKGRGKTAWTEFVEKEKVAEFLEKQND